MADYSELGFDSLLDRSLDLTSIESSQTSVYNPVTSSTPTVSLESGEYSGNLILARDASIRGGATDYNDGIGFWLGYRRGTSDYGFFIGNSAGNKLTYNTTDDTLALTGTILSTAGAIGGWTIGATTLSSGNVTIDSANEVITMGSASAPLTGDGVWMGKDGSDYEFRAGDPAGEYIHYDGSNLTIVGGLAASDIHIPDQDTTANSMHVESDGDTWWGCTQTNFTSDPDNAAAYVLSTGEAKFQNVTLNTAVIINDATVNDTQLTLQDLYGDGNDGNVTISGDTTITEDMFYDDLTIDATKTLNTGGFRVHVKGTLTINGTIGRPGNAGGDGGNGGNGSAGVAGTAGSAGAAGAALADGSIEGAVAATAGTVGGIGQRDVGPGGGHTNGGNSGASTAGNGAAKSLTDQDGVQGTTGGTGGDADAPGGSGGTAGAAGAAGTKSGTIFNKPNTGYAAWLLYDVYPAGDNLRSSAGSSGSSGGGGGASMAAGFAGTEGCSGGGGGGGGAGGPGGLVAIYAKNVVVSGTGVIIADGGDGGNGGDGGDGYAAGANGACAGGGGGGGAGTGGSGGAILLIYSSFSNSGSVTAAAGSAGSAGNGGTKAEVLFTATDGSAGNSGNAGNAGTIIQLQV